MAPSPLLPSLHILHLEDNPADAELIQALLENEWPDCSILVVQSRPDFVNALESSSFDVILSDFSLPQFDGMAALSITREHEIGAPFIFVSGTIGEENAVRALQHGATDYVLKDRPARLVTAVQRALTATEDQRQRLLAEHKLREQAALLDKIRDAIIVCDLSRRVTYWNHGAERILGWTAEESSGRNAGELMDPAALSDIESARPTSPDGEWRKEVEVHTKSGRLRTLECRVTVIRDASGNPKSHLFICADVTETRQLERQFYRSQRLESIGTLAGGIAHDLNNVLTPILMSVSLVTERTSDPETLRIMSVLQSSAHRGATLIRQILAYARGAEGERTELHLKLVVREVVALLAETLPKSITVETNLPEGLTPIVADFTQISQVLMNLCVNSRDAMPNGGLIAISASDVSVDAPFAAANPDARAGRYVRLVVSDSGTGIPPEIIDRIFDPFFTTKGAGMGTGLGLSTTLGIVKSHGGFVQVQSPPGEGTCFSLYFPAVAAPATVPPAQPASPLPKGSGETILVIDDDRNIREVMRGFLEASGYRALLAEDGTAGIATYLRHRDRIQCVITDLMMPGMQGDEVVDALRSLKRDIPIIVISGVLGLRQGAKRGAEGTLFLAKPMSGIELAQALRTALTQR